AHPSIDECLRRCLRSAPIANCGAIAANPQIPDFAVGCWTVFMIDQPSFVTAQQFAAAAVAHLAFVIRHEHMQHLSRANAVEHFYTESALPFFAKLRRQSLAR